MAFVEGSLVLTKFFRDCTIFYEGIKISRAEVVQHVAYGRDGLHYGRSGTKDPKKADILDFLASSIMHNRDLVFYVYLSIAQTLTAAPDIQRFIERVEQIIGRKLEPG